MSNIKVRCSNPRCGIEFDTHNLFGGSEGTIVHFRDIGMGTCPQCGHSGQVMNGSYKFDKNGLMSILIRPEFTGEVLHKLHHVAEIAQQEKYTPEKFKAEIISIGIPDAFLNLVIPQNPSDFYSFLSFLVAMVFGLLSSRKNSPINNPISGKKNKNKKKRTKDADEYRIRKEYQKNQRNLGL